jgi:Ca2+-binding RTX toxin-like protein
LRRRLLLTAATCCVLAWAGAAQAGTVSVTGDDVNFVAGSSEVNRVVVAFEEVPVSGVRVVDIGASLTAGAGCSSVGGSEAFCPTPTVGEIVVALGDQSDWANTSAVPDGHAIRLEGGGGNDTLNSGANRNAVQDGGPGADFLSGEGAIVDYSARTDPLTVTTDDGVANDGEAGEGDNLDHVNGVLCGHAADRVTVQGFGMFVSGGAGNDELLDFGDGATDLVGGPGADFLKSIGFQDSGLHGGDGNDTLIGGNGSQSLDGGAGRDLLRGGPGPDRLTGGDGADELVGGKAKDQMRGGSGNDTLRSRDSFKDLVYGNQGTDRARVDERDILGSIEDLF